MREREGREGGRVGEGGREREGGREGEGGERGRKEGESKADAYTPGRKRLTII